MAKDNVTDPRFSSVHKDPRFARASKKKTKLKLDSRFEGILTDDKFQPTDAKYDKYGRKLKTKDTENMKKFYKLEEEEEKKTSKLEKPEDQTRLEYLNQMARGELSDSDSNSSSDSSDDDDEVEAEEEEKEDIPMGDSTNRMAIMNCDWSRIRAVDLFVLLQSFAPQTGVIKRVDIFPSQYGIKMMKEEEERGPQGIWKDTDVSDEESCDSDAAAVAIVDENNSEESDSALGSDEEDADPLGVQQSVNENDVSGFDQDKLRNYELQKLKYYYAVVTCDSVKTAAAIYDQCDQAEYETSSNNLDLRFIPNDMDFANNNLKDSCTSVPDNYKPNVFVTNALQKTDIELTWEQDDQDRNDRLTRVSQWQNMDQEDFSAYIADSGSENTDVEDDDARKNLRRALLGSDADGSSSEEENADGGDMEMTFTPGAGEDVLSKKHAREAEESETPWEAYQRSKKAEKQVKRQEKREKKRVEEREMKANLALPKHKLKASLSEKEPLDPALVSLFGDSKDVVNRDFNMKEIIRTDRMADKKLKGKRKKKEERRKALMGGLQDGFKIDTDDKRFAALYDSRDATFAIDPTDSRFKKTRAMEDILSERRESRKQPPQDTETAAAPEEEPSTSSELSSLVASVKRKLPASTKGKQKKWRR